VAAINVVTSKTSFTQSRSGSQTLRNEVALDQATIPALCSPARRRPRRYGTGEQADGKLPDYGPGRQAGICAAIWACGCTLRCSQGRWYLKGTAPLSEPSARRNAASDLAVHLVNATRVLGELTRLGGSRRRPCCAGSLPRRDLCDEALDSDAFVEAAEKLVVPRTDHRPLCCS